MDQVRTIALAVWQQRFWVLSVIGLIVAVVCWNSATGELQTRFTQRIGEIGSKFSAVTSVTSEAFHPNDDVNKGDEVQYKNQKVLVSQLWSDLYEQQRTKVLFWPELGDGFAEQMGTKKFQDDINNNMRDKYRNYIKTQFDALRKIVKASDLSVQGRGGRNFGQFEDGPAVAQGQGEEKPKEEEEYLVDWLDQDSLRTRLVFSKLPSSVNIWVTQEDLWVYETLLNVIAKTNEMHGATRSDNTAIRTIVELQVGKDATATNMQQDTVYMPMASGEGEGSMQGYGDRSMGMEDMGGGFGEMGGGRGYGEFGGSGESDSMILGGRYLDEEGEPYSGDSGDFGTEFRKLPIRMVLEMDQRMIPLVLVECANATLPIEVTRLSVNREQSNKSGFTGMSSRAYQSSTRNTKQAQDPRALSTVDIQGVVLIYQPPDESVQSETDEEPTT